MLDYEKNASEWEFIYKKGGTAVDTHKIFVWKVDTATNSVYFRVELNTTTTTNMFLKYTTTENNDLMRSVQEDDCDETYDVSIGTTSGSLVHNDKTFSVQDADTQFKNNRTFTFSSGFPGFFGHIRLSQKKQLYDNDDKPTTSEQYDWTVTAKNYPDQPLLAAIPNKLYCVINSADPAGAATYRKHPFRIDLTNPTATGSNLVCNTTGAAIDINADAIPEFDPGTEL